MSKYLNHIVLGAILKSVTVQYIEGMSLTADCTGKCLRQNDLVVGEYFCFKRRLRLFFFFPPGLKLQNGPWKMTVLFEREGGGESCIFQAKSLTWDCKLVPSVLFQQENWENASSSTVSISTWSLIKISCRGYPDKLQANKPNPVTNYYETSRKTVLQLYVSQHPKTNTH